MKLPRGFGKNYFSLSAITATVNQVTLAKESTRIGDFHTKIEIYAEEKELEELEELPILCLLQLSLNSCHCNYFFKSLTIKILKLFITSNKKSDYYILLNTSLSPPNKFLIKNKDDIDYHFQN